MSKAGVRFTKEQMALIALFEDVTKSKVKDLVTLDDTVVFVVEKTKDSILSRYSIGLMEETLKKKINVIVYTDDVVEFLYNAFKPLKPESVSIKPSMRGGKYAVVAFKPLDKSKAIGRGGRRAELVRMLTRKYFGLETVLIR